MASRPTLKSDAEGVTKQVDGVTSVVNQSKCFLYLPWIGMSVGMKRAIYGNGAIGVSAQLKT
jgi:hypothetical protein